MYYDDLPVWGFIGKVEKEGKNDPSEYKYYLFKHLHFTIFYNKDRVIEIAALSDQKNVVELTENKEVNVEFMYAHDEESAEDQEETGWKYIHGDEEMKQVAWKTCSGISRALCPTALENDCTLHNM
ncbi:hypothetical protein NC651_009819 [Populus alba x Populus x berolinensis]|nr:hypothetical protein NC651_009819 [Populus alba x Populus x berolinensis]